MKPIRLNSTTQKSLYDQACRRMAELVPGWSDSIPSDPAVAVLELASYLSDMQNRKWDFIGPSHYHAYLKLLGGSPGALTPATLLTRSLGAVPPYRGQRFWVDGVSYEVMEERRAAGEIGSVLAECGSQQKNWEPGSTLVFDHEDIRLHLSFTRELPPETPIRIWCGLTPEPGRVPPDENTPPPVALRAQIPEGPGWRDVALNDGTCGLLQSGYWTVTAGRPFLALRITAGGRPEGRPCIRQLVLEPVRLEQRLTRSAVADLPPPFQLPEGWAGHRVMRYFLPADRGSWREAPELFVRGRYIAGWSDQPPKVIRVISAEPDFAFEFSLQPIACEEVILEEEGILPENLRLMVQEKGVWYDCPIREPDPHKTLVRGCRWDWARKALLFGDGRDYRVPAGGTLLVAACATTLGSAGNGAAGVLHQGGTRLLALSPAAGGCDTESERDAFYRVVKEQAQPLRVVTPEDYEALARKTPGLALGQVHAVVGQADEKKGSGIIVLAKPISPEPLPVLTPWQAGRLREWLEQYRMIGVPVFVQSPRYVPLAVTVSLRVSAPVDGGKIRAVITELADGVAGSVRFGAEISYTALFAAIGRLEHVLAVTALELHPLSGGVHCTRNGAIHLKPDMLPYLKELQVTQT